MIPVPKPFTHRSDDYLDFIRSKPCLVCGRGPSVPAHQNLKMGGMSKKVHDSCAVPLCNDCHTNGGVNGEPEHKGLKTFWDRNNIDVMREIIKLNAEYMHLKEV